MTFTKTKKLKFCLVLGTVIAGSMSAQVFEPQIKPVPHFILHSMEACADPMWLELVDSIEMKRISELSKKRQDA